MTKLLPPVLPRNPSLRGIRGSGVFVCQKKGFPHETCIGRVRAEPAATHWAIVQGTLNRPILHASGTETAPHAYREGESLAWLRQRVKLHYRYFHASEGGHPIPARRKLQTLRTRQTRGSRLPDDFLCDLRVQAKAHLTRLAGSIHFRKPEDKFYELGLGREELEPHRFNWGDRINRIEIVAFEFCFVEERHPLICEAFKVVPARTGQHTIREDSINCGWCAQFGPGGLAPSPPPPGS